MELELNFYEARRERHEVALQTASRAMRLNLRLQKKYSPSNSRFSCEFWPFFTGFGSAEEILAFVASSQCF